jgi:hypothetical protein
VSQLKLETAGFIPDLRLVRQLFDNPKPVHAAERFFSVLDRAARRTPNANFGQMPVLRTIPVENCAQYGTSRRICPRVSPV